MIGIMRLPSTRTWLFVLIAIGAMARAYDISAPWKRKDHYNYGGVHTSRMAECLATTPLTESKGIPHVYCEPNQQLAYPNHPPTILFSMNAWKTLWGSSAEWTYRSFVMIFSWLNILLVYLIAARLFPQSLLPFWAAAVQSLTLGGLYFGTHPDFICEFAVFFPLLAAHCYLRGRPHWGGAITVVGGLASWPGFIFFAGQAAYLWLAGLRKKWPLFLWGVVGVMAGLAMMMWLNQALDLSEFLQRKLVKPGYLTAGEEKDRLYVLSWIKTFFQYHSNYLSPLFLLFLLMELYTTTANREWNRKFVGTLLLIGGGGILYTLIGERYVYVHAFLYLYLFPLYSLLIGRWIYRCTMKSESLAPLDQRPAMVVGLVIFVLALYPYGRLQTNLAHDVCNSLLLVGSTLAFAVRLVQRRLTEKAILIIFSAGCLGNVSQMINYRNEPAMDYLFCVRAREEFRQTQQPVLSAVDPSFTRDFYCRGIPVKEAAP